MDHGAYKSETSRLLEEAKENSPSIALDKSLSNQPLPDLDRGWRLLEELCASAAETAERQLAGEKLNERDRAFVSSFGNRLCSAMLYVDHYAARDDAPRVVDIYANLEEGGILHAAVGRPVAIYVNYPYQGRKVYCRGAVMPYYEFIKSERLDDSQWKEQLSQNPRQPQWVQAINGHGAPVSLSKAKLDED
jgi:hypothetical protein